MENFNARYNNYHKHDHVSNIYSPDTNTHAEEYIKKCVEYGHTNYFTTNHGSLGDIFEAKTLCDKYGVRCLAGLEGYIVPNPLEKDKSNYHIIIIPRTDEARKKVNIISSRANMEGYYYKPRIFPEDLLALDKEDVYITTACVAGLLRDEIAIENIFMPLYHHFGTNLLLEVQNHNDAAQKEINRKALVLSKEFGLRLIAANDSHYVDAFGQEERLELLKGKHINYGDEDSYILDFPNYATMFQRFKEQGVLSDAEIYEAIQNTLIFDECEEIGLDKSIKMPTIYPDLSLDERVDLLKKKINEKFSEIKKKEGVTGVELDKYLDGIRYEMKTIEDTNDVIHTADYFLFNEKNVDLAVNKYGGVLTRGGRGSCGSFYINRILGMTQLDRFKINLPIFPDRFASTARLLENMSLPDIDYNVKEQEPFVKASKELLGENGCYPMIAYGTMQIGEAFRNVCRSKDIPFHDFNEVAKNIEQYTENKQWKPLIEEARKYVGTIVSASVHPCAHILSDKDIIEEYGVVRLGDNICVMITSAEADEYKVLKNDYLIVTVWKLIDETFKEIGIPIIDARELLDTIKADKRIWDLFKNGITCTLNQVDSDNGMQQAKRYGISSFEDGAFIAAAIRPSFDSWRESFLSRAEYSTGSKDLDAVLSMTKHYILFQENLMQYFDWLGVTPAESIGLIKKISKKKIKQEDFDNLETRLKENWIKNTGSEDKFAETWAMIQSCIAYGFCSAHAAATSLDMCYGAYLKVNYPYEYYSVCFNNYADDAVRTAKLRKELEYFGITLSSVKFRYSRALYSYNKAQKTIYKGMGAIKYLNNRVAEELYELGKNRYGDFVDLLYDIKEKTTLNTRQLDILIKINFFEEFGDINTLLNICEKFQFLYGKRQIKKDTVVENNLPLDWVKQYSGKETYDKVEEIDCIKYVKNHGITDVERELADCVKYKREVDKVSGKSVQTPNGYSFSKIFRKYGLSEEEKVQYATKTIAGKFDELDVRGLLKHILVNQVIKPCTLAQRIKYQLEHLGYIEYLNSDLDARYIVVMNLDTTYAPRFQAYCLKNGQVCDMKIHRNTRKGRRGRTVFKEKPIENGDILYMVKCERELKKRRIDGKWTVVQGEFVWWLREYERVDLA